MQIFELFECLFMYQDHIIVRSLHLYRGSLQIFVLDIHFIQYLNVFCISEFPDFPDDLFLGCYILVNLLIDFFAVIYIIDNFLTELVTGL